MRALVLLLAAALPPARAEIIDSVAASVGRTVITRSDAVLQLRIQAFIDGEDARLEPSPLAQAVDRLIDQELIRREIEISRYPTPAMDEIEPLLAQVRQERFPTDASFQRALARAAITEEQLRQALLWQLTVVRFLQYRFRPAVQVPEADLAAYYRATFVPDWRKSNPAQPPPLDDVRDRIESLLAAQRSDEAMERWLAEARAQARVRIHRETLE
ncbi:MAG: hypothetical protein SFV54_28965 [Bryobacteraceae bacterium]|nr:hypothetical protein [Bryobacteraceae bacterium]